MSSSAVAPYNWQGYLLFAQMHAGAKSEVLKRTAASRAYYALFNVCRDWLEARGYSIPNRGAHKTVWDILETATDADSISAPDWRLLAQHGITLRTLRNSADYDDEVEQLDHRVENAVTIAQQGFRILATLKTGRVSANT